MEGKCVVCHDRPMKFRCIQCHKPVCDDCAFKTEHGAFCSRECSAAYRNYRQASGSAPSRRGAGGALKLLIGIIILAAIAAAVAWKMGWLPLPPNP